MKAESQEFSILLHRRAAGPFRGRTAWERAAVDFGTQATMDGKVAVVCPQPSLRYCRYFDWQSGPLTLCLIRWAMALAHGNQRGQRDQRGHAKQSSPKAM